jgi:hypothetical protein
VGPWGHDEKIGGKVGLPPLEKGGCP